MTYRYAALLLLVSCAKQPAPSAEATQEPKASAPSADAPASSDVALPTDCEPRMFADTAGNHDRFRFEAEDGRVGYRDAAGDAVIAPRFAFAYEFSAEGIAAVVDDDGFAFIDINGDVLARAFAFDNGPDYFQEGRARIVDGEKVGFIATDGSIVVAPQFEHASAFCEGLAVVCQGCRIVPDGEHSRVEGGTWG